jgi:hypothetical protein
MRTLKAWTTVGAIALVLAAQATAARPGAGTTYVVGSLTVPGVSTGLVLQDGQQVTVAATGAMCPWGTAYCVGPDGNASWYTTDSWYGGYLLPGAPAWGLVGRVGNGPWVHVGGGPTTLSGTGELVFAANDDLFPDNTDNFVVTVSFECWPGWGHGDDKHPRCGPPGGEKKPKYDRSLAGQDAHEDSGPTSSNPRRASVHPASATR